MFCRHTCSCSSVARSSAFPRDSPRARGGSLRGRECRARRSSPALNESLGVGGAPDGRQRVPPPQAGGPPPRLHLDRCLRASKLARCREVPSNGVGSGRPLRLSRTPPAAYLGDPPRKPAAGGSKGASPRATGRKASGAGRKDFKRQTQKRLRKGLAGGRASLRSEREPASGPACARGMPSNTPLQGGKEIHLGAAGFFGTGLAWPR